jgi:hypothetical protein
MTATKTTTAAGPFGASFDEAADRIRALNEKLLDAAKQTGTVSLDAYEKALSSLVEFETKVAGATQLDWVNTVVKAQTSFLSDISAAYTAAAREVLK